MSAVKRPASFQCLRCTHSYEDDYSPQEVVERACPQCGSNSVRRVKKARPAPGGSKRG